jgi:hypothetical protein
LKKIKRTEYFLLTTVDFVVILCSVILTRKEVTRMVQYDYSRLLGRVIEKYGSRADFAVALGVTPQTVCNKFTGRTPFTQFDITRWADTLGIQPNEYYDYFFKPTVQHA